MNVALWIVAGILATAYFVGGGLKVIMPKDRYSSKYWRISSKSLLPLSPKIPNSDKRNSPAVTILVFFNTFAVSCLAAVN
jgi:hypothetical protein